MYEIRWFNEKRVFEGSYVWRFMYTLRIKDIDTNIKELPIYSMIEHRLSIKEDEYYLEIFSPHGVVYDKRLLGKLREIDPGVLLSNLICAYLNSYRDRARAYRAYVIEYIDPLKICEKIHNILREASLPVFSQLLERIDLLDDEYSLYAQTILVINQTYISDL
ncbi:MAG: hypothetical protein ABWJ42_01025 [Sulfolobales archaeon]